MATHVCGGASLKCTMGSSPGKLLVTPQNKIMISGQYQANIADSVSMTNIQAFGLCQSLANPTVAAATAANLGVLHPMPCIPNPTGMWSIIDAKTKLAGQPALFDQAQLPCMWAGMITISDPGQQKQKTGAKPINVPIHKIDILRMYWIDNFGYENSYVAAGHIYNMYFETNAKANDIVTVSVEKDGEVKEYHCTVDENGLGLILNMDF